MSKYYVPDKPFKIKNWNDLVKDVNDILDTPPAGSDCEPSSDKLDEVEDPHRWAKSDIRKMREALEKTCPDIKFTEELKLWKQAVIDEIEEQMKKAWCNCSSDIPDTFDSIGYTNHELEAAYDPNASDGVVINGVNCYLCPGLHCYETIYYSHYYPCLYNINAPASKIVCDQYTIGLNKGTEFIDSWNNTVKYAQTVKNYQTYIDSQTSQLDALIAQFKASCVPMPDQHKEASKYYQCQAIKSQICNIGKQIAPYQDSLDFYFAKMMTYLPKIRPAEAACNEAAIQNNQAAQSLQGGRFPTGINHWATDMAQWYKPQHLSWGKWFDPYTMKQIGLSFNWQYGIQDYSNDPNSPYFGIRPYLTQWWISSADPAIQHSWYGIRCSPAGSPLLEGRQAQWALFDHTYPYLRWATRARCEPPILGPIDPCTQPGGPGDCEFGPYGQAKWYWGGGCCGGGWCGEPLDPGGCGFGGWVWAPINPPAPSDLTNQVSFHGKFTWPIKGLIGKDYTDKQDKFLDEYQNWYRDHPKYDNRHQQYC